MGTHYYGKRECTGGRSYFAGRKFVLSGLQGSTPKSPYSRTVGRVVSYVALVASGALGATGFRVRNSRATGGVRRPDGTYGEGSILDKVGVMRL